MSVRERAGSRHTVSTWPIVVVSGLITLITAAYLAHWGRGDGLDLHVYRAGIAAWRSGGNPYAGSFTVHHLHYTYPPFSLVALAPLTWLPFSITQCILWALSVGALAASVYAVSLVCGRSGGWGLATRSVAWASLSVLIVEPVRSALDYGQVDTILLGLVVVDLLVVPRRSRGVLVGLAAAVKLTPLLFLLLPLLERDWRTFSRALAAGLSATGLMWVFWPHVATTYWTKDVFDARRVGNIAYAGNQSLYGDLHRWPFPADGLTSLWIGLSAITVVVGLSIAHRCVVERRRVAALLALALVALLISPVSWTHHWVWLALVPPILLLDHDQVPSRPVRRMLWLLFAVSVAAPYWWFTSGVGSKCLGDALSLTAFVTVLVWGRHQAGTVSPSRSIMLPPMTRRRS
jgi:alpha-1,2-mannosyltransferase